MLKDNDKITPQERDIQRTPKQKLCEWEYRLKHSPLESRHAVKESTAARKRPSPFSSLYFGQSSQNTTAQNNSHPSIGDTH